MLLRQAVNQVAAFYRMKKLRHEYNEMKHAAAVVQRCWRDRQVRLGVLKQRQAALKLQRWFRCMIREKHQGQQEAQLQKQQEDERHLKWAVKLQGQVRIFLARKHAPLEAPTMTEIPPTPSRTSALASATLTPSRIPRPVSPGMVKPRVETPTPKKAVTMATVGKVPSPVSLPERRTSLRIIGRAKDTRASSTGNASSSDLSLVEKKRRLQAVREERERLKAQLLEQQQQQWVTAPTSTQQPAPKAAVQDKQAASRDLMMSVILPNLGRLSENELKQLTEANTQSNGGYTRPVEYQVIKKQGPRPPSPNAKTLAKFAEAAKKHNTVLNVNNKRRFAPDGPYHRRVQFKSDEEGKDVLTSPLQSTPTRAHHQQPGKTCLKVRSCSGLESLM
jgi:hypothetical protein